MTDDATHRGLAVYLRDHFAGAAAGLALVRRCRRAHEGTGLDELLAGIEVEIEDDRRHLQEMMSQLGVTPSAVKTLLGSISERIGRLKSNGRLGRRSPSSTVVELEGLAAGIVTKRNLWRSLRVVAIRHAALEPGELDTLIERATSQLERIVAAHDGAAHAAFEPEVTR
jgi:uncharacterized protein YukE